MKKKAKAKAILPRPLQPKIAAVASHPPPAVPKTISSPLVPAIHQVYFVYIHIYICIQVSIGLKLMVCARWSLQLVIYHCGSWFPLSPSPRRPTLRSGVSMDPTLPPAEAVIKVRDSETSVQAALAATGSPLQLRKTARAASGRSRPSCPAACACGEATHLARAHRLSRQCPMGSQSGARAGRTELRRIGIRSGPCQFR